MKSVSAAEIITIRDSAGLFVRIHRGTRDTFLRRDQPRCPRLYLSLLKTFLLIVIIRLKFLGYREMIEKKREREGGEEQEDRLYELNRDILARLVFWTELIEGGEINSSRTSDARPTRAYAPREVESRIPRTGIDSSFRDYYMSSMIYRRIDTSSSHRSRFLPLFLMRERTSSASYATDLQ